MAYNYSQTQRNVRRGRRQQYSVDPSNPRGVAQCQGCNFSVHHDQLHKQMAYRGGSSPVWTGFWVCTVCLDRPNQQPEFKRQVLKPDPVPFENALPLSQPTWYIQTENHDDLTTEDGERLVTS